MSTKATAQRFIASLIRKNPRLECPNCFMGIHAAQADLFYVHSPHAEARKQITNWKAGIQSQRRAIQAELKRISTSSLAGSRSVNIGLTLEKLLPALPSFPFDRNDCRALGNPLDLIVFENLARHGRVTRILFADVKTGSARLSQRQRSIKEAVEAKCVTWSVYG